MGRAGTSRFAAAALACACLSGCGSSTSGNSHRVTRAQFGASWPLTVSEGTLGCTQPGRVTFTADDGTVYWVNGLAGNVASQNGWLDIRAIWANDPSLPGTKKDIGVLIDRGLSYCG